MVCYNHERYIEQAIESILHQTYGNFELIIVDDGSQDQTQSIIRRFNDKRIRPIFKTNEGPSAATNTGLSMASGEYIALMSGDDISYAERVEKQLDYMTRNELDVVFSLPDLINDNGKHLPDSTLQVFYQQQFGPSEELFRTLFYRGNFLCAPSAFLKKSVVSTIGNFNIASIQLQDFDYWIRCCLNYKIGLMYERLVKYRLRNNGENLSDPKRMIRIIFEQTMIYRAFFNNASEIFMNNAFPDFQFYANNDSETLELDKSFLYLTHPDILIQSIGAERLFGQIQYPSMRKRMASDRGFYLNDLYELMNTMDISNFNLIQKYRKNLFSRITNKIINKN